MNTTKKGCTLFTIWLISMHFLALALMRFLKKKKTTQLKSFHLEEVLQCCSVLSFVFNLNFCSIISTVQAVLSKTQILGFGKSERV